jgi:phytoene desaturase
VIPSKERTVSKKRVVVVGAGPGGLTAAMILASKGYAVDVYEKAAAVGGRNAALRLGDYTFDTGPTFLMMRFILEEVFELCGRKVDDYLDIRSLDPLYRLIFGPGQEFLPTSDRARMREQIERMFPGNWPGYERFMEYERRKFARLEPCLRVPYSSPLSMVSPNLMKAAPYLDVHKSLIDHLGGFFDADNLKLAFTFQAKYLGMSPWQCPGLFSMIAYIEHSGGIHHPIGGLNRISHAMAKVVEEEGGRIHLATPVKRIDVRGGKAAGVVLESGDAVAADHVVLNADFGHAMSHLVERQHLRKWTPETLEKKGLSCSIYMLYLGVNRTYDLPHHNIFFAPDYRENIRQIAEKLTLPWDPSFYVQNASVTDPTLAPKGKSTIYVLVPVPNSRGRIDWAHEEPAYRKLVMRLLETRAGLTDISKHVEVEHVITPQAWEDDYAVYRGAVFNLAHGVTQMLYFRPHNQFEDVDNCYLVGGGTHPGSGLPTIYESGRISAGLILKRDAWYL